ncbi:MAG: 5'/3'-nucleotidase SurE [Pseudomonadota bacterium]|nr:5'/3'-nucleotidase SurE [Pseudomonadota bacterium]
MRILISNDDGASSPGIRRLADAARLLSQDVWIVAPARKWTAASHQLTFDAEIVLERVGPKSYTCSGAPADCIIAALAIVLRDAAMPALVLSGINDKRNVAEDLAYSGTMAVAREATFWGIPAIALSSDAPSTSDPAQTRALADVLQALWNGRLSWAVPGHWLSLNLPASLPAFLRQATIGHDKIGSACDVVSESPARTVYRNRRGRPGGSGADDENAVLRGGSIAMVRHTWCSTAPLPEDTVAAFNPGGG